MGAHGLRCRAKEPSCREFRGLKEQRGGPLGWGGPGVSSTLSSCCSAEAFVCKQGPGGLPRLGELGCGRTALMGILLLCLSFSLGSRGLPSRPACPLPSRGLGKLSGLPLSPLVGRGDELGTRGS